MIAGTYHIHQDDGNEASASFEPRSSLASREPLTTGSVETAGSAAQTQTPTTPPRGRRTKRTRTTANTKAKAGGGAATTKSMVRKRGAVPFQPDQPPYYFRTIDRTPWHRGCGSQEKFGESKHRKALGQLREFLRAKTRGDADAALRLAEDLVPSLLRKFADIGRKEKVGGDEGRDKGTRRPRPRPRPSSSSGGGISDDGGGDDGGGGSGGDGKEGDGDDRDNGGLLGLVEDHVRDEEIRMTISSDSALVQMERVMTARIDHSPNSHICDVVERDVDDLLSRMKARLVERRRGLEVEAVLAARARAATARNEALRALHLPPSLAWTVGGNVNATAAAAAAAVGIDGVEMSERARDVRVAEVRRLKAKLQCLQILLDRQERLYLDDDDGDLDDPNVDFARLLTRLKKNLKGGVGVGQKKIEILLASGISNGRELVTLWETERDGERIRGVMNRLKGRDPRCVVGGWVDKFRKLLEEKTVDELKRIGAQADALEKEIEGASAGTIVRDTTTAKKKEESEPHASSSPPAATSPPRPAQDGTTSEEAPTATTATATALARMAPATTTTAQLVRILPKLNVLANAATSSRSSTTKTAKRRNGGVAAAAAVTGSCGRPRKRGRQPPAGSTEAAAAAAVAQAEAAGAAEAATATAAEEAAAKAEAAVAEAATAVVEATAAVAAASAPPPPPPPPPRPPPPQPPLPMFYFPQFRGPVFNHHQRQSQNHPKPRRFPPGISFTHICRTCGRLRGEHPRGGYGPGKCQYQSCGRCGARKEFHDAHGSMYGFNCHLEPHQGASLVEIRSYEEMLKKLKGEEQRKGSPP